MFHAEQEARNAVDHPDLHRGEGSPRGLLVALDRDPHPEAEKRKRLFEGEPSRRGLNQPAVDRGRHAIQMNPSVRCRRASRFAHLFEELAQPAFGPGVDRLEPEPELAAPLAGVVRPDHLGVEIELSSPGRMLEPTVQPVADLGEIVTPHRQTAGAQVDGIGVERLEIILVTESNPEVERLRPQRQPFAAGAPALRRTALRKTALLRRTRDDSASFLRVDGSQISVRSVQFSTTSYRAC